MIPINDEDLLPPLSSNKAHQSILAADIQKMSPHETSSRPTSHAQTQTKLAGRQSRTSLQPQPAYAMEMYSNPEYYTRRSILLRGVDKKYTIRRHHESITDPSITKLFSIDPKSTKPSSSNTTGSDIYIKALEKYDAKQLEKLLMQTDPQNSIEFHNQKSINSSFGNYASLSSLEATIQYLIKDLQDISKLQENRSKQHQYHKEDQLNDIQLGLGNIFMFGEVTLAYSRSHNHIISLLKRKRSILFRIEAILQSLKLSTNLSSLNIASHLSTSHFNCSPQQKRYNSRITKNIDIESNSNTQVNSLAMLVNDIVWKQEIPTSAINNVLSAEATIHMYRQDHYLSNYSQKIVTQNEVISLLKSKITDLEAKVVELQDAFKFKQTQVNYIRDEQQELINGLRQAVLNQSHIIEDLQKSSIQSKNLQSDILKTHESNSLSFNKVSDFSVQLDEKEVQLLRHNFLELIAENQQLKKEKFNKVNE